MAEETVVEEGTEAEAKDVTVAAEDVCALDICEHYASSYERVCQGNPDLMEILVKPAQIKEREAYMVFRYGTKRFKVSFEQVERVRKPKEVKGGG